MFELHVGFPPRRRYNSYERVLGDFSIKSSAALHNGFKSNLEIKFIFSKKATKIGKIFTVDFDTYYIKSNRG